MFAGGWWAVSAHKWFKGPVRTVESPTMTIVSGESEMDEKEKR